MKKILSKLLWLLLLCIGVEVHAAHLVGGEITYTCLGYTNNDPATNSRRYQITINVFRDSQSGGSEFDNPNFIVNMHVTIYAGSTLYNTYELDAPFITTIDPNPGNPCLIVPPNIGVEQGQYGFIVDLPIIQEDYHIVYQRCCRNNTVTNIFDSGGTGSTYTVSISALAQQVCNSSPSFSEYPPIVLCAGQPFVYDFSATDADGDQLVYELCAPFDGGGNNGGQGSPNGVAPDPDLPPPFSNVVFRAPTYSALMPLGATADMTLNAFTGIMRAQPELLGQFVVGVCVSEYRNGQLLSTVRRDFQFNVTNCTVTVQANLESLVPDTANVYVLNQCAETQVNITNSSGQVAFINTYDWEFEVNGEMLRFNTANLNYNFPGPGAYPGRMIVNRGAAGCSDTANVLVNIFPDLISEFTFDYDTCVAEPVQFTNLSSGLGGQALRQFQWDFGDGGSDTLREPFYRYANPGLFVVRLRITDENGCQNTSSQTVAYFPVPELIVIAPSEFRGCVPAEIFFNNLSSPISDEYMLDWDFGEGGTSGAISPTHTYETPGLFSVGVHITSPLGCTTDTVFNELILIEPAPVAGFDFEKPSLNNFDKILTIADQSSGAYRWFYNFNGEATSLNQNPSYELRDTGLAYVTQVVSHVSGCLDSLTKYIDVVPEITFFFPNAFSPNGDGSNDDFKPKGFTRGFKYYQMTVWNRWGEPLFTTNDPIVGWNGQKGNAGQNQPPGAYMYEAQLTGPRGEPFTYRGYVTLIR